MTGVVACGPRVIGFPVTGRLCVRDNIPAVRKDLRESPEYAAVAEHLRRLYEPSFGRPHHVTDLVMTTDASRIVVTDRKSTRLNSSHSGESRMPSSA